MGDQTDEDFDAYLADAERVLRRRERYAIIIDARRATPLGPKLRKRQADWLRAHDTELRAHCVALGMILNSPVQRGVFRAISWMAPPPYPYTIESSFEGARHFVSQHLERHGCALPPIPRWWQLLGARAPRSSRVER